MSDQMNQKRERTTLPNWPARVVLGLAIVAVFLAAMYTDLITHSYWGGIVIGCVVMAVYGFFIGYAPRSDPGLVNWSRIMLVVAFSIIPSGQLTKRHAQLAMGTNPLMTPYFYAAVAIFCSVLIFSNMLGWALFRRRHPGEAFLPPDDKEETETSPQDARVRNWIIGAALAAGMIAAFLAYYAMSRP